MSIKKDTHSLYLMDILKKYKISKIINSYQIVKINPLYWLKPHSRNILRAPLAILLTLLKANHFLRFNYFTIYKSLGITMPPSPA